MRKIRKRIAEFSFRKKLVLIILVGIVLAIGTTIATTAFSSPLSKGLVAHYPLDGESERTGRSCKAILDNGDSVGDGTYIIDPDGPGGEDSFQAYCDMTTDGGGWTLVAKFKSTDSSHWAYADTAWSDDSTFNDDESELNTEITQSVKFKGYSMIAANDIWVGTPQDTAPAETVWMNCQDLTNLTLSEAFTSIGGFGSFSDGVYVEMACGSQTYDSTYTCANCKVGDNFGLNVDDEQNDPVRIGWNDGVYTTGIAMARSGCGDIGYAWASGGDCPTSYRADALLYVREDSASVLRDTSDITPNENHGVVYGATLTTDRMGVSEGAMSFDGSSYAKINTNSFMNDDEGTVSLWVKPSALGTTQTIFMSGASGSTYAGGGDVFFLTLNSGNYFYSNWRTSGEPDIAYSNNPVFVDTWYHIVVRYSLSELRNELYINGVEQTNQDTMTGNSFATHLDKIIIGAATTESDEFFNGSISDVRIYDRALSEDEIKLLYDSFKPKVSGGSLNKGLVGHWQLDSENGAKDLTPYSNDGTATGGITVGGATDRKGKTGGATEFDGSSQRINIPNTFEVRAQQNHSYSAWIKLDSSFSEEGCILAGARSTTNSFGVSATKQLVGREDDAYIGGSILTTETWYHVAYTFEYQGNDIAVQKLYLNGVEDATRTDTGYIDSYVERINYIGYDDRFEFYFNGIIDDVRAFNKVLSADEISLLYDSYKPKEASAGSLNKGLVLDMPLTTKHMKSSTVVSDLTPYGNDGTVSGATVGSDSTSFDGSGTVDGTVYGDNIVVTESVTNTDSYPDGCTYSVWLNADTDAVDRMSLFRGSSTIRHIEIYSSGKYFRTEAARQNGYSFGAGGFPDDVRGQWSHFVIVFANGETNRPVRWYQNGELFHTGSMDSGTYPGTEYFSFGSIGRSTGTTSYNYAKSFDGNISNFKIYNRALEESEIKLLYDKGRY